MTAKPGDTGVSTKPGDRGPYEIQRILVLSTGHITSNEMDALHQGPVEGPLKWRDPYGVGLVVLKTGWVDFGPNVAACLKLARSLGCEKLNFDMDGPTVADLPTFDW